MMKVYFENCRNKDVSSEFTSWSSEKQEEYLTTLHEWFKAKGQRSLIRKAYDVVMEKISDKEAQLDFLIYDTQELLMANEDSAYLWVVFKDGTTLIDLNCLRFAKNEWTSRLHFESILGFGGKRTYFVMNKEEGLKCIDEETSFEYLAVYEQMALKKCKLQSEDKRKAQILADWKDKYARMLSPKNCRRTSFINYRSTRATNEHLEKLKQGLLEQDKVVSLYPIEEDAYETSHSQLRFVL